MIKFIGKLLKKLVLIINENKYTILKYFLHNIFIVVLVAITASIVFFWWQQEYSIGCISGDCNNGYGTYIYRNGSIYRGGFYNTKPNGTGVLILPSGTTLQGHFVDGKLEEEIKK